ncbi:MAG: RCC1 domain-containing protein, partial [Gemmatimonadaceae bacterium]
MAKTLVVGMLVLAGCVEQVVVPRAGVPTLDDPQSGDFIAVSAGLQHTCALAADSTAYCWGSNEFGQLGTAPDTATCARGDRWIPCRTRPAAVVGDLKFIRISAGGRHTCGITGSGSSYCWGDNLRGELGDPAVRTISVPNPVVGFQAFTEVVLGGEHSCGLRADGFAFCWGANEYGQLGISSGGLGMAAPESVRTNTRFASIVAGSQRTCGRTGDGAAFCWGSTWVTDLNGAEFTRSQTFPARVQPAPPFKSLTAGTGSTCGIAAPSPIMPENVASCWEGNSAGGIGDGTIAGSTTPRTVQGNTRFVSVASGALHTCGISDSGFAYCWGAGGSGQLGVSLLQIPTRCGSERVPCVTTPVRVSGWRQFTQLTAGQGDHTCGLTIAGNVFCWGAGGLGQRG